MGGLIGRIFGMRARMPKIPQGPVAPDNGEAAQARIAEAAKRERERAARRRGRGSNISAGEINAPLTRARRQLLGVDGE